MKILHLNYTDKIGGAAIAANRIHNALLESGIDSNMLVKKSIIDDEKIIRPKYFWEKFINYFKFRFSQVLVKLFFHSDNKTLHSLNLFSCNSLVNFINKSDYDVIHLHWIGLEMLSIEDLSRINKPIVWTLHDMWAFCGAEHYSDDLRWKKGYFNSNRPREEFGFDINKWVWERKRLYWKGRFNIICPSDWLSKCAQESKLMEDWSVTTIPYPISNKILNPLDKNLAKKTLGLDVNVRYLLFGAMGGTKDPRKGFDFIEKFLPKLKEENIKIIIFGQKNKIKKTLRESEKIINFGIINDFNILGALYSSSELMIIPSRMDNLPNTALESLICARPIVAFRTCGLSDIVDHRLNGYLSQPFDVDDLYNGIRWILNLDSNSYNKVCLNAKNKALTKYSPNEVSKQYLDLYQKVCKEKN